MWKVYNINLSLIYLGAEVDFFMKDMIERIVEMDEQSRKAILNLQQDKVNSEKEIQLQKEKIKRDYLTRARKRIESNRIIEQNNADEKLKEIEKTQKEISLRLNEIYEKEGDKLINEMIRRILGE